MGQNLKETFFLGNITWYEMWKENIQGVFGFIWDKVVFIIYRMQRVSYCKKSRIFLVCFKVFHSSNNIHLNIKRFITQTKLSIL